MSEITPQEFIENLLRGTNRDGIEELLEFMKEQGFYTAPASTKFHGAYEGALAEHSINVYNNAVAIAKSLSFEWFVDNADSIGIVSLLHDLGKAGQYGKPYYIENILKSGRSNAQPYKTNDELLFIPHEVASVVEASRFIRLTEDEQRAILWHNGLYGAFKYDIQGKETPLYMVLHFADMWASRVDEREVKE